MLFLAACVSWRSPISQEACYRGCDMQQHLQFPRGPLSHHPACKYCLISWADLVFLPLEWMQVERLGFVFMSVAMQTSLPFRFYLFGSLFLSITCIASLPQLFLILFHPIAEEDSSCLHLPSICYLCFQIPLQTDSNIFIFKKLCSLSGCTMLLLCRTHCSRGWVAS